MAPACNRGIVVICIRRKGIIVTPRIVRAINLLIVGGVVAIAAAMLLVDDWPASLAAYHAMSSSETLWFWVRIALLPVGAMLALASLWTIASRYIHQDDPL